MIKAFIDKIFNTKVDALGLSVFRILYAVIISFEIANLFRFRNIVYDKIPFDYVGEINVIYIFGLWVLVLICLFLGLFTRTAVLLNYIFGIIVFGSASKFEYHVFYTYTGVNFLLLFMPISRVFSLDSLIIKVKYSHIGKTFKVDRKILEINYLLPVYVGIALIYFDSIFLKLQNKLWTSGLGVWLPSSIPMAVWHDTSLLLNQKEVMYFLGYFVLVFEALFIFLFWFKKIRLPLMFIGIFFHIGILITYPIPLFALAFVVIYLLLVPASFWLRIATLFKSKKIYYTFYYDAECPLCNKVVVVIKHLDVFHTIACKTVQGNYQNDPAIQHFDEEILLINIHGVTSGGKVYAGYWCYVQLFKSLKYLYPLGLLLSVPGISHLGKNVYRYIAGERLTTRCTTENCTLPEYTEPTDENQDIMVKGWNQLSITKKFWKIIIVTLFLAQCLLISGAMPGSVQMVFNKTMGVARHGVFLDHHFKGYNHIFKVVYVDKNGVRTTIPIIDDQGMPGAYTTGIIWRNISFNVVTSRIKEKKFEDGILPYLKFYLADKQLDASQADFEFYYKEIETPVSWEKDFLHKQMAKPWIKAGTCKFKGNANVFEWNSAMDALTAKESK